MRRLRPILRRIAVFAMLGLATTVLVAWALAAWLPHRDLMCDFGTESSWGDETRLPGLGPNEYVEFEQYWRPGMCRRAWNVQDHAAFSSGSELLGDLLQNSEPAPDLVRFGPWAAHWGRLPDVLSGAVPVKDGLEDARGWPAPALWCRFEFSGRSPGRIISPIGGVALSLGDPARPGHVRALPLLPVWPGLIVNITIYGVFWALVLWGVRVANSATRRRRGLCVSCAYDLRNDHAGGCPECGMGRANR